MIKILPQDWPSRELRWGTLEDHMILLWDFPTSFYQYLVIIPFNGGCYNWFSQQFLCFEIFYDVLPTFRNPLYKVFQYQRIFFFKSLTCLFPDNWTRCVIKCVLCNSFMTLFAKDLESTPTGNIWQRWEEFYVFVHGSLLPFEIMQKNLNSNQHTM